MLLTDCEVNPAIQSLNLFKGFKILVAFYKQTGKCLKFLAFY